MAVDKMWDVLRFLRTPQKEEEPQGVGESSLPPEEAKHRIDSKLEEALKAAEELVDRYAPAQGGDSLGQGASNLVGALGDAPVSSAEEGILLPPPDEVQSFPLPPVGVPSEGLEMIPVDRIRPNPYQPRLMLDEEEIRELADSIRQVGVLQPLLVRPVENGYELVAGERRLRAAREAGLERVPALIVEVDPHSQQLLALVENLQRKNLSAVEEARCLQDLLEKTGWSQGELAKRLGRSQAAVANKIRLLKLDPEVQELVVSGRLSERHARSLLSVPLEEQRDLAYRVIEEELNVRDLERIVGLKTGGEQKAQKKRVAHRDEQESQAAAGPAGDLLRELAALVSKHRTGVFLPNGRSRSLPRASWWWR
ncbi:ParB-like partition protein [Thermanaerovibrio velox DSM 12556]|uniref:ParB-like partition protein n=1 Tax=Thermanaerovibrio velox DSM 12556 TaxID=926567 RepID=H0USH7_9BACT|nr:ParB-like partition protein [Thermanaerovibrio velox DSM 12556]